ncbi:CynX/NimT family MFS transporter [Nocardioides sp.]|uniref:MFS transporter n=1 Tax=Nocardioides sp. TaxID=35761 RepID=UPI003D0ACF5A
MPTSTRRAPTALLVVGIVALSFNLRPAAVSVGPVLHDIRAGLGMTPTQAGVLTSLPVLAFAMFGALAPRAARRLGVHRTSFIALLGVVVGLALRSWTTSVTLFLVFSVVALAGMATANVLLPSLIKVHFPDRIGLLTAAYTTALSVGLTMASILTVPLSTAFGSWRWGLLAWAATAALAALPWVGLLRHDRVQDVALSDRPRNITLGDVARTRLGWAMALCFGLQSLQAYAVFGWFAQLFQDSGFTSTTAGLLLGVITGISIPVAFFTPGLAARLPNQSVLFLGLIATYAVGYTGLLLAPRAGAWWWAALIGIGTGVFPVVLTLIGLRSRTEAGTAALSGFTQSVGYLISAIGPFGMGFLYERTGGWTVPLVCLLVLLVPLSAAAVYVSRPLQIEDQLTAH